MNVKATVAGLGLLFAASVCAAHADDTTFTVTNATDVGIAAIFASPAHEPNFPSDPLPDSAVAAGTSVTFTIENGACAYDLRFVFDDGGELGDSTDFCETGGYTVRR